MCLLVDPVQVLKNHHQRLIETFAEQQPLERLERAALAGLRVHFGQRVLAVRAAQQTKEKRQASSSDRSRVRTLPVTLARRAR